MTDCKAYRSEIEESANGLSDAARAHASSCSACGEFQRGHDSLRRLVGGLERVEAPADFEFRLRARMAARRGTRGGRPFAGRGNLYGFGAVAAAMCFLVVSASLYFWQGQHVRPGDEASGNARAEVKTNSEQHQVIAALTPGATANPASVSVNNPAAAATKTKGAGTRSVVRQRVREVARAGDGRKDSADNTLDEAQTFAQVISRIPLGKSPETLRVVLRDEHGAARVVPVRAAAGSRRRAAPSRFQPRRARLRPRGPLPPPRKRRRRRGPRRSAPPPRRVRS